MGQQGEVINPNPDHRSIRLQFLKNEFWQKNTTPCRMSLVSQRDDESRKIIGIKGAKKIRNEDLKRKNRGLK